MITWVDENGIIQPDGIAIMTRGPRITLSPEPEIVITAKDGIITQDIIDGQCEVCGRRHGPRPCGYYLMNRHQRRRYDALGYR